MTSENRSFFTGQRGGAGLLLLVLVLGGCEIQQPATPTFSTRLNIPIGEERIEMSEVIAEEDIVHSDSDGSLSFLVSGDPDTLRLEMDLTAELTGTDIAVAVGIYHLDIPDSTSFTFNLAELYPAATGLDGSTVPVPPFGFDLLSQAEAFDGLVSADVAGGQLVLELTNGLPVPVSGPAPPETLRLTLLNSGDGSIITTVSFTELIAPFSQATAIADLAGVQLTGTVAIQLSGGSSGAASPVAIHATDGLLIDAWLQDMSVREAISVINPQRFETHYAADLPDSIQVVEAEISRGLMDFTVTNNLPIPCVAELHWDEILDTTGQPLISTITLEALSSLQQSLDLAEARIHSPSGSPLSSLGVTAVVTSPGSDGLPVHLAATDSLQAATEPVTLSFASLTGSIPAQDFTLDPIVAEFEIPDEASGVALTAASLVLRVDNGAGMPAEVLVTVSGTAADSSKATMDVIATIQPAGPAGMQETIVLLDQTNSNIVQFLNHQPETIEVAGVVLVGGEDVIGTVQADDLAVVSWEISAPLEIIFSETVITSDPDDLQLDTDTRELIRDHALGAHVRTEVTNHMPFSADLTIYVSQDTTTIATAPLLTLELNDVAAGLLDPVLHTVVAPSVSYPTLELTRDQMLVFGIPDRPLYTLLQVTLPGSEGPVRLHGHDYLQVRGIVNLEVLVED